APPSTSSSAPDEEGGLARAERGAMNFFSSEAFIGAVAASFFRRRDCRVSLSEVGGRVFRGRGLGAGPVVHDVRFLDYLEPLPRSGGNGRVPGARFLRRVCHGVVPVERYEPEPGVLAAPLVRWERFSTCDDFVAHTEARSK